MSGYKKSSDELLHLVQENARLLKWCRDEGWQLYPPDTEPLGFSRCLDGYIQWISKADSLEPPETISDPIVVQLMNFVEELIGEPVYYKGGVDQFLGSGKYESFVPYEEPDSPLKAGVLYFGENGMIICSKCAGVRESSGEGVVPVSQADMDAYQKIFREEMRCEKGCTGYAS